MLAKTQCPEASQDRKKRKSRTKGNKLQDLPPWKKLVAFMLLPRLVRTPEVMLDQIAAKLAKRRPLTEEEQAYQQSLNWLHSLVLLEKRKAFKANRSKNRMRHGWRDGTWSPTLPDVPARLREIDARRAGAHADEWLAQPIEAFAEQIMSQHGEDGITYEILTRVGMTTRRCIELGCGHNGGNAGFLVVGLQYRGLLMDGNREYTDILKATLETSPFPKANGTVVRQGWITRDTINSVFEEAWFSGEIDYLGIDLDGMDWWIWEAITAVNPRMVCIEFNALFGDTEAITIPYRESFYRMEQDAEGNRLNAKGFFGASLMALIHLGRRKGYRLVGSAPRSSNAYFVREDLAPETPTVLAAQAYRTPYKARQEELRQQFQKTGIWEAAQTTGTTLVRISETGLAEV